MIIRVHNERAEPITALLIAYDTDHNELQRDVIPAGGLDYARPGMATHWIFQAPGYQDAARNDLLNYEVFDEQLIPKNNWVVPVLIGAAAYWVISKFFFNGGDN